MINQPRIMPMMGERMRKLMTGTQPFTRMTPNPALAIAAPAKPLMMAWEELVGSAISQVMMSHAIAPISPPQMT